MMVHGQNGAHLSELLLRNRLEGYTQGKGRGLTMACRRRGYRRAPEKIRAVLASLAREGSGNTRTAPDACR